MDRQREKDLWGKERETWERELISGSESANWQKNDAPPSMPEAVVLRGRRHRLSLRAHQIGPPQRSLGGTFRRQKDIYVEAGRKLTLEKSPRIGPSQTPTW